MRSPSEFTFYGYEQRTNVSRLFKITATPRGLFFGWIADRDYEEMLARLVGHGIGQPQVIAVTQQSAQGAARWEDHYETLDVENAQFIQAHPENFAFHPGDGAASLLWKLKWTEKAATRFGALDLVCGGKKRRFYLVGQCSPAQVAQAVRHALPDATIEPFGTAANAATPDVAAVGAGETVPAESVYKRPNWPVTITAYLAAIGLSLWIAATFDFWIPLGACAIALPAFRMMRFGGIIANFHKNSAEQLRRNRARDK